MKPIDDQPKLMTDQNSNRFQAPQPAPPVQLIPGTTCKSWNVNFCCRVLIRKGETRVWSRVQANRNWDPRQVHWPWDRGQWIWVLTRRNGGKAKVVLGRIQQKIIPIQESNARASSRWRETRSKYFHWDFKGNNRINHTMGLSNGERPWCHPRCYQLTSSKRQY